MEEKKSTGRFTYLCELGDKSMVWDRDDADQVKEAKEKFDKWIAKGHKIFKIVGKKKKQVPVTEFDPKAEELLVIQTTKKG
jgi:hypothetical protein